MKEWKTTADKRMRPEHMLAEGPVPNFSVDASKLILGLAKAGRAASRAAAGFSSFGRAVRKAFKLKRYSPKERNHQRPLAMTLHRRQRLGLPPLKPKVFIPAGRCVFVPIKKENENGKEVGDRQPYAAESRPVE